MDPTACLLRLMEAIQDQDFDEAKAALLDLHNWLNRGGFLPTIASVGPVNTHLSTWHIGEDSCRAPDDVLQFGKENKLSVVRREIRSMVPVDGGQRTNIRLGPSESVCVDESYESALAKWSLAT